jgi:hypothetical protein
MDIPSTQLEIGPYRLNPPASSAYPQGGGWTITALCIGLGLIAACVIIPQADANRRLGYERDTLLLDLAQLRKQAAVNHEFLAKVEVDPQLVERLAQRQMKMFPQGETVLNLKDDDSPPAGAEDAAAAAQRVSPFSILRVPPPPSLPAYQPVGGTLAAACRQPQSQLYLLGAGMFLVAVGLVMGESKAEN